MTERAIEQVLVWIVNGVTGTALEQMAIGKAGVPKDKVKDVIAEASRRITLAADYNRDEMLGTAINRLNSLYLRFVSMQKDKQALEVQREINRLAGLYRKVETVPADSRTRSAHEEKELAAVAGHLLPLKLADPAEPISEHARLAALRIIELTAYKASKEKS